MYTCVNNARSLIVNAIENLDESSRGYIVQYVCIYIYMYRKLLLLRIHCATVSRMKIEYSSCLL